MTATVRVGIVSWNTADLLDRCLTVLPAALDGLDSDVVVVDNASTDHSAAIAERHDDVHVVRMAENVGYARGMNRALADSEAPVLIALNPDTEPPPASLRRLVEHLLSDPGLGLVVPRLIHPDGSLQHSVHRFPSVRLAAAVNLLPVRLLRGALGRRLWVEGTATHQQSGPVDWAYGAVHVLRAASSGTRPYSERWFMYVEDLDLCWRLRQDGWRTELDADVEVVHIANAAGAQRWGADRTRRWLAATYDWYASAHGRTAARAYAATNLVGAAVKGTFAVSRGWVARDRSARSWGDELLHVVPTHARAFVHPDRVYGEPE